MYTKTRILFRSVEYVPANLTHPVASWILWHICWCVKGQYPSGFHYNAKIRRPAAQLYFLSTLWHTVCMIYSAGPSAPLTVSNVAVSVGPSFFPARRTCLTMHSFIDRVWCKYWVCFASLICKHQHRDGKGGHVFSSMRFLPRKWLEFVTSTSWIRWHI